MSKKTMREQIEEIRQLDPAMLKLLNEYDDEKVEKFVTLVSGKAKDFKTWAQMERALKIAEDSNKEQEQDNLSRAAGLKFGAVFCLLSMFLAGALAFIFKPPLFEFFFEKFGQEKAIFITNTLICVFGFGAFANSYLYGLILSKIYPLFKEKEVPNDPILRALYELYKPAHKNDRGYEKLSLKALLKELNEHTGIEYESHEVGKSLNSDTAWKEARSYRVGEGRFIMLHRN